MIKSLIHLFNRDLDKLISEIELTDDNKLWIKKPGITNTIGNLALHLCGNLNHFIGATLGSSGYVRQRDKEFSDKNVSKEVIIDRIEAVKIIIANTLNKLTSDQIASSYPINVFDKTVTTEYFLIHLHSHLNYHLGQINYLRRILTAS